MEVILLERTPKLGNVGDLVNVKNGYARNYLIPQAKALRATEENKKEFEAKRAQIEKENNEKKVDAEKLSKKLENKFVILIRQAGEDGRLFGSVTARDIAKIAADLAKEEVNRNQVVQFSPIKSLGVYGVKLQLHGDVVVQINVNVARTETEAEIAKKEFLNPPKDKKEDIAKDTETDEKAVDSKDKKKAKSSDKPKESESGEDKKQAKAS